HFRQRLLQVALNGSHIRQRLLLVRSIGLPFFNAHFPEVREHVLRRLLQRRKNPVQRADRSVSDRRLCPPGRLLRASNRRRQPSSHNETEKRASESIPQVQHGAPIVYLVFCQPYPS